MSGATDRYAQLRATHYRMIDSWLRQGMRGWRFHDSAGRGHDLDEAEATELRDTARARVDRHLDNLEGQTWLILLITGACGFLIIRVLNELHLLGMSPSWILLLVGLSYMFKDTINEIRFALGTEAWRETIAKQLRARSGREAEGDQPLVRFDARAIAGMVCGAATATLVLWLVVSNAPIGWSALAATVLGLSSWSLLRRA